MKRIVCCVKCKKVYTIRKYNVTHTLACWINPIFGDSSPSLSESVISPLFPPLVNASHRLLAFLPKPHRKSQSAWDLTSPAYYHLLYYL